MHLMLLRFSSLGDVVIQTSFASWIKSQFSYIKITFVTSKEFVPLLINHPHIDQVIGYERKKGLKDLFSLREIPRQFNASDPVDFIIDLHGTTRSFFLKFLNPQIPVLNLDKRRLERQILVLFKINFLKKQKTLHERTIDDYQGFFGRIYQRVNLENFLEKLSGIQGSITSAPDCFTPDKAENIDDKYIVLAPVASFKTKRWPVQNFIDLSQKILEDKDLIDYGLVIVAGPKDDYVDGFSVLEKDYFNRVKNLKGKTSLNQSSQIIRDCSLLIGNDTGMVHVAESYGVNVITIFGPTHESFGFRPHRVNSLALSSDVWCRPCSTTGKKKCFRSKQFCMENVTIETVFKRLKNKLISVDT